MYDQDEAHTIINSQTKLSRHRTVAATLCVPARRDCLRTASDNHIACIVHLQYTMGHTYTLTH